MKPTSKLTTKRRHFTTWVKTDKGIEIRATHTNAKDAFKSGESLMNMGYKEVHVINTTPDE